MSTLDEINQHQEQQQYVYRNHGRDSLLDKYRIPIQHFDFEYVATTNNWKELEQMVDVLRSGQEGYYPDLLRVTEDRLRQLKPNSRFLRQTCKVLGQQDLNKEEKDHIQADLHKWVSDVSRCNKELEDRKTNKIKCDVDIRQCDPQPEPLNLVKNKNEKRISSTDYSAWDKYDPDAELMKQELEEEKIRTEHKKAQELAARLEKQANEYVIAGTSQSSSSSSVSSLDKPKKKVRISELLSETEAMYLSNRELDKGREYFRIGDYAFAAECFSHSLMCKPSVTAWTNRALCYLKLDKFPEALKDCNRILAVDGKNVKALLRKAQALEGLKKYEEALDCVDLVIEKDPNNTTAQELAERVRKFCRNVLKNTRMKIIEIE